MSNMFKPCYVVTSVSSETREFDFISPINDIKEEDEKSNYEFNVYIADLKIPNKIQSE
jgi:hypothetical protein